MYRLSWEMVRHTELHQFCNADPAYYKNVTQIVPNSQIPDKYWYTVSKETDDPWSQYHTLRQWAMEDREFVRNVKLDRRISTPEWEEVTDER